MGMQNKRLLLLSLTALSIAGCAPARHVSQSSFNDDLSMFTGTIEDFEYPDFGDDQEFNFEGDMPDGPVITANPDGRKPAAWDGKTAMAAQFTAMTEAALEGVGAQLMETVPTDIQTYCPKYSTLDREGRKGFWLMLISAMTKYESTFNPEQKFQENFKNSKNEFVVSRGLLQLSSESANGLGCRITSEAQLEDPATNLTCGVRILNRFITKDGKVAGRNVEHWQGGARYWSVLRAEKYHVPIQKMTRRLAICGAV